MSVAQKVSLSDFTDVLAPSERMPVVFLGHGNPLNAINNSPWAQNWDTLGEALPEPKAILCISAHWMTQGETLVNVAQTPPTIHDFGPISPKLFEVQYPASGAPEVARDVVAMLADHSAKESHAWGLDHGAWSVLRRLFPAADVPVFQMSIDLGRSFAEQLELGRALKVLRDRGVLVLGSGNLVHNLPDMRFDGGTYDWALEFDEFVAGKLQDRDFGALTGYDRSSALFQKAHPTPDHYVPAMYCLGLADPSDDLTFFNEGIDLGCTSMRSVILSQS